MFEACAMMRNIVGTRAEAPVGEQNHNCSPILSCLLNVIVGVCLKHVVMDLIRHVIVVLASTTIWHGGAVGEQTKGAIPTLGKVPLFKFLVVLSVWGKA